MVQAIFHYSMHFLVPGALAWLFFRPRWLQAWLILVCTMLIDLDHLLSTPIFDAQRCSIGFHPLHTLPALLIYLLLLLVPSRLLRIIATGLLFHLLTDFIDCFWMLQNCSECCQKEANQWLCRFMHTV